MRKLTIAASVALLMGLAAPAFAGESPAGTSEGQDNVGTTEEPVYQNNNQVDCGSADDAIVDTGQGITVKAAGGADGGAAVVCNEGDAAPVQGRVIAAGDTSGGWVAADGDQDNDQQAQGYARANIGASPGTHCGDTAAHDTDSANPEGPGADCTAALAP